jgi:ribosomal protein S18 acetylase RimI-like enzyme
MPQTLPAQDPITIVRLVDSGIRPSRMPKIIHEISTIFFEAAGRTFESGAAGAAFSDLWLGQYLSRDPDKVHVALATGTDGLPTVRGYLVGCWENPVGSTRFAALPFFPSFSTQCHAFPGQLHINLDVQARSQGIGRRLVDAFAAQSQAAGVPGIHVITSATSRNVSFYKRTGFEHQGTATWNGKRVVFLGRRLAHNL